jgi:hypothetical protein
MVHEWFKKIELHLLGLICLVVSGIFLMSSPGMTSDLIHGTTPAEEASIVIPSSLDSNRLFRPNIKITEKRKWTPNKKNPYWKKKFFSHTFSSGSHSIGVYRDNIYTVWYDTRRASADIYFSRSNDGGGSFNPSIRINDDLQGTIHYKPSLGVDAKGTIYVAWRDDRNGHADIYFTRSIDGGKSFSGNIKLNDDPGWAYQGNPSLAVGPDGLVGVAWNENRDKNDNVYFTLSHDGGVTFSKNQKANDDKGDAVQSHPTVAIGSNGLIVIAWQDFRHGHSDIYMMRSIDGGKTFSPNQKVNKDKETAPQVSPSAAISGKTVLIAWADYRNDPILLSPPDSEKAEPAWWEEVRKRNADIYYSVSRDGGSTFTPNAKLNDDSVKASQAFPSTAVDGHGRLFVAWEDYRNENADTYFAQSSSEGTQFGPNIKVNDDTGKAGQYHPSLISDLSGRTYIIWTDVRDFQQPTSDGEGNFEDRIDYKKKKVFKKTLEDVYFAIGMTDEVRLSKNQLP